MKNLLLITLILTALSSCSPSARIARICKNHPEACLASTVDTIRDTIKIHIPGKVVLDSSFVLNVHDTIRIKTPYTIYKLVRTGENSFHAIDSLKPQEEKAVVPVVIKKTYKVTKVQKNIGLIVGLSLISLVLLVLLIRKMF